MPEGYGYSPEGLARYRKDQEQKRTLGSTDAPRITASPSPVRPHVRRKTDPNSLAHLIAEMFANLGGEYGGLIPRGAGILANKFLGRKSDMGAPSNLSNRMLRERTGSQFPDVQRANRRNRFLPRNRVPR